MEKRSSLEWFPLPASQVFVKPVGAEGHVFVQALPVVVFAFFDDHVFFAAAFLENLRLLNGHEPIEVAVDDECGGGVRGDKVDWRNLFAQYFAVLGCIRARTE